MKTDELIGKDELEELTKSIKSIIGGQTMFHGTIEVTWRRIKVFGGHGEHGWETRYKLVPDIMVDI